MTTAGHQFARRIDRRPVPGGPDVQSARFTEPGAPFAYVTTRKFLAAFGLAGLRDLPDLERLEDEGWLQRPGSNGDLDAALGLMGDDDPETDEDGADFDDRDGHRSADWSVWRSARPARREWVSDRRAKRFLARCLPIPILISTVVAIYHDSYHDL